MAVEALGVFFAELLLGVFLAELFFSVFLTELFLGVFLTELFLDLFSFEDLLDARFFSYNFFISTSFGVFFTALLYLLGVDGF